MSAERLGLANGPFRLGDRLVTPDANEIDGARIDPKLMDVLVALVEGAPAVMSAQVLLDRVWPDVVVVPNVVYQAIAQLRKALGDEPRAPRYIETIPRRGYRVIAEIRVDSIVDYSENGPHDRASSPAVPKYSICVLPFVNMSGEVEQEYLSDGTTEDIITDLSNVSALSVIARTTAFTFKGKSVNVVDLARQLNVSHVLEGSVRKAGGRVRITAQLVDAETGGHVWAQRYDRDLNDIFALQDEISEAIVNALTLKLLPQEKQRIKRRGTSNLEAYDLYTRGTSAIYWFEEVQGNISLLEAAIRLAPDYSDAWAAMAFYHAIWRYGRPYSERNDLATVAAGEAERALELNPHSVLAVVAQFLLMPAFGRFINAESLIRSVERHAQQDPLYHWAHTIHLESVGRVREAVESAQRAYDLDPLNHNMAYFRGQTLAFGGRQGEARRSLERTVARWPANRAAVGTLIEVYAHTQDWVALDKLLTPSRLAEFPLGPFEGLIPLVAILRDPSPRSLHRPISAARRQFEASGYADLLQLQLAARFGDAEEAHAIGARAKFGPAGMVHDAGGYDAFLTGALFNSMVPEFRRDPRFIKLCARLGLVDYWLTTFDWPDCVDEVAPYYDFKAECEQVANGPLLPPAY